MGKARNPQLGEQDKEMYIQILDSKRSLASWFSVPCEKGGGVCEVNFRKRDVSACDGWGKDETSGGTNGPFEVLRLSNHVVIRISSECQGAQSKDDKGGSV